MPALGIEANTGALSLWQDEELSDTGRAENRAADPAGSCSSVGCLATGGMLSQRVSKPERRDLEERLLKVFSKYTFLSSLAVRHCTRTPQL